ncbi:Uncharacterized protein family UPF0497, trans-membrane plant [Cynara cardunculus var. scolymus]|uniref:CASP-like protein n=1 Tax=Cynara cardunculus var. scolymus TaxID=59895 RepID=A0A103XIQ1_CYNCS|nr:Uncharacterized protein family UPF0497, trans-membrane plant [Cynara cardunculus var. scolymus]
MASTDTKAPTHATTQSSVKWASQLSGYMAGTGAVAVKNQVKIDAALRAFLCATALVAVIVMVTSKQNTLIVVSPLMLGIVASATGAGGGVAYEALKGNPHIRWNKICHIYDIFCRHLGFAMSVSLLSSMTLLVLVWLSVCVLAKNSGRR